ncbi:urease accessory UreF family protein [soil metagenome]
MSSMNLLLLADGRFPAGGHAHSGGMETAIAVGAVKDLPTLTAFLTGRLATAGLATAGLAAASCTLIHPWDELDAEADARTPSPALREVSRKQGRQLLRTARALWAGSILDGLASSTRHAQSPAGPEGATNAGPTCPATPAPAGPHHPVALGAAAAAAGLKPLDAARATVFNAVTGPASAAVRLLGLDPVTVHRLLAQMAAEMDDTAHRGAAAAAGPVSELPCPGSVLLDLYAQQHAESEMRLFAS